MGSAGSKAEAQLREELATSGETVRRITSGKVTGGCQSYGLASLGARQWKGNGVLALTDRRLIFRSFTKAKSFECATQDLQGVELSKRHPSGVSMVSMLKVTFAPPDGPSDEVFLLPTVKTQEEWVREIQAAIPQRA